MTSERRFDIPREQREEIRKNYEDEVDYVKLRKHVASLLSHILHLEGVINRLREVEEAAKDTLADLEYAEERGATEAQPSLDNNIDRLKAKLEGEDGGA